MMLFDSGSKCSFCSEFLSDGTDSFYINKVGKPNNLINRKLYETSRWIIIPTIGGCVENYLLFIHKEHTISAAYCDCTDFLELNALIKAVYHYNYVKYKKPTILFEHGTIEEPRISGCCVTHTHFHVVPFENDIERDIEQWLKKAGSIKKSVISSCNQLTNQLIRKADYIFYQSPAGKTIVFEPKMSVSQLIRQIIFAKLGIPNRYDWRISENYFLENIIYTIEHFDARYFHSLYQKYLSEIMTSLEFRHTKIS